MLLKPSDSPVNIQQSSYLPPPHSQLVATPSQAVSERLIQYNHITYALYVFSYFTAGLTWIIPIVMNYMKRDDVRHTWLYSHFDWQIKTFWYSIFFGVISGLMIMFGFGGFVFGAALDSGNAMGGGVLVGFLGGFIFVLTLLWHLYRIVRGWIALSNRRPVP